VKLLRLFSFVIAVLILLIGLISSQPFSPDQSPPKEFTGQSAQLLIEKMQDASATGWSKREEQRNLLMGWTITIIVAVLGLAFTRNDTTERTSLFMIAIVVSLFMHVLDTILMDQSIRQAAFSWRLSCYLVKWDSLTHNEMQEAISKVSAGNEPNDNFLGMDGWKRKSSYFICGGAFLTIWWWGQLSLLIGLWAWPPSRNKPPI
jgi:hypothetical protein